MRLSKAISRLVWRFRDCKFIKVNNEDKIAVNRLLDFVQEKSSKDFKDNIHFAKLYTFCLSIYIERYKASIDDTLPHKELHKLLDKPFEYFVLDLTERLNLQCQYSILEEAGCNLDKHPSLISESEMKRVLSNLQELLIQDNNKKLFSGNIWTVDEIRVGGVKNNIKNFINEL